MKTLAQLQAECADLGITIQPNKSEGKRPWIAALQEFHWNRENPGIPLPPQIEPMLLSSWNDLGPDDAQALEADQHGWIVQEKKDGVRALLHIENGNVRITGRCFSEVTYRLSEHQDNLPHLVSGLEALSGTILDGELVCPEAKVDTGSTITESPLQAAVAILAASPAKAARIQQIDAVKLRLHVFDILKSSGADVTRLPLFKRMELLARIGSQINNPFLEIVPSFSVNKPAIHHGLLERGGEGTVWKRANEPYQPGRRVKHWIKRKREIETEAFVSGFKPGTADRGNGHLVGAVEFSIRNDDGTARAVAWVCSLTKAERFDMTKCDEQNQVILNPTYLGRRAIITGQDRAQRSDRFRHARIKRWLDLPESAMDRPR